jgi:hypothetical protein
MLTSRYQRERQSLPVHTFPPSWQHQSANEPDIVLLSGFAERWKQRLVTIMDTCSTKQDIQRAVNVTMSHYQGDHSFCPPHKTTSYIPSHLATTNMQFQEKNSPTLHAAKQGL